MGSTPIIKPAAGLPDVLPIDKGGTGATSAAAARTALGVPANDHKHSAADITSGVLSVSKGGTGATSTAAALSALGATRIETGSYVGNGSLNKSLTFSFAPVLVAILCAVQIEYENDSNHRRLIPYFGSVPAYNSSGAYTMIPQALHTSYWTNKGGFGTWASSDEYATNPFGRISSNGKTVYWKGSLAGSIFNDSTMRYYYLAIG